MPETELAELVVQCTFLFKSTSYLCQSKAEVTHFRVKLPPYHVGALFQIVAKTFCLVLFPVPPVVESLYSLSSHETIRGSLGQTIVLLCGLHKERHVTYAWFKDGDLLPNSSENTNELTVALQEQQDFGVYECEAFNQAAKVRKRLEVFNEDEEGRGEI